jgi:hypothetical protein
MASEAHRAECQALARQMAALGYQVIAGVDKGGCWVRNPDMTRPPFVDENSFLPLRRARRLFGVSEPPQHGG